MGVIRIRTLGLKGVNVDKDPLELDPSELRKAQNAIKEPLGANAGITNRPGLLNFSTPTQDGSILGGIGVLTPATSFGGGAFLFLGRGGEAP